ncbi:amino acid permease [Spiroplasma chinense]|uniref:Amino acid permease n=1 Tax=Spiroplasma chinense TaxID=216932 RepID=A0A5B9Y6N9_9MOLU|nr:amino acid permease [Spiroplasma chinense]QEH62396.1 amino acid permease [Spiroplasma chinense]
MVKVNKKNKFKNKTFEFLTIFSLTFGIVVGSGIYLKNSSNDGVLKAAGNNPWVAMAVWLFVGVFACMMMFSFIEASTAAKKDDHNTMATMGAQFLGRRFGTVFSIFYIVIYLPVLTIIGALFTVNALFGAIDTFLIWTKDTTLNALWGQETRITVELLIGVVVLVSFQFLNSKYFTTGKWIQIIFTILKFVPLLMVLFGGFGLAIFGKVDSSSFDMVDAQPFKVNQLFACLIPILFAFDGFVDSVAAQKDIEHKSVVAPAMLAGIISVSVFYLLVTVAIFVSADDGNILEMFNKYGKVGPRLGLAFNVIIVTTLLATINAYTTLYPKVLQASVEEGYIYNKNFGEKIKYGTACWVSAMITNITLVIFVALSLGLTWKTGEPDYFLVTYYSADTGILYVFIIYALIMGGVLHNRKTKKVDVKPFKNTYWIQVITLSVLIIMDVWMLYVSIIDDGFVAFASSKDASDLVIPILFIGFGALMGGTYWLNEYLITKNNKIKNVK